MRLRSPRANAITGLPFRQLAPPRSMCTSNAVARPTSGRSALLRAVGPLSELGWLLTHRRVSSRCHQGGPARGTRKSQHGGDHRPRGHDRDKATSDRCLPARCPRPDPWGSENRHLVDLGERTRSGPRAWINRARPPAPRRCEAKQRDQRPVALVIFQPLALPAGRALVRAGRRPGRPELDKPRLLRSESFVCRDALYGLTRRWTATSLRAWRDCDSARLV